MEKLLVSVEEAAEALGIGRSAMYELIASKKIRSVQLGRRRLVPVSALRAAIGDPEPAPPATADPWATVPPGVRDTIKLLARIHHEIDEEKARKK